MNLLMVSSKILARLGHVCIRTSKKLCQFPQRQRVSHWFEDQGDKTLRLNYDLDANSLVFDLGGYEGQWASDIFSMYRCRIHVFEVIEEFAQQIETRFARNPSIIVHHFGLGAKTEITWITQARDGSSIYKVGQHSTEAHLVNVLEFFKQHHIDHVDLMKINIEGGEYDLLDSMLDSGLVTRIENIQVQFHDYVPHAEQRMRSIQERLAQTHFLTYQYPFVWENWRLRMSE